MDLNPAARPSATALSLATGIAHETLENDGPRAFGDRMGTPAPNEKVLWKGRPDVALLARSAFHTRSLGLYMAGLIGIALIMGNTDAALVAGGLGAALMALLYLLAWTSARTTLYILTDARLILRIGMAIETRINLPLKQITAAHLRLRDRGRGDIAFELSGERVLGTMLLWPHVRPWRYARPQPMLRAVADAAALAQMIAEARGQYGVIARNLTEIKEAAPANGHTAGQPAATTGRRTPVLGRGEAGLEGAPA